MSGWVRRLSSLIARTPLPGYFPVRGPLIVMYHGIGGVDGVAPQDFAAQLELLTVRRRVVPLAQIGEALGTPAARDLAAITFDDGYVDFAELAMPILAEMGLHATLFVPGGLVGRTNSWDAGVYAERRILDAAALRALDPTTVEIGGHGFSHRRMAGLEPDVLARETRDCRQELERIIARRVRLFAYPYGQRDDFDREAERAVEDAGFTLACSTCFGRGSRASERFRLRRVGIEPQDDLTVVAAKLDGAYDWVAAKERVGHALRSLRSIGRRPCAPLS